MKKFVNTLTFIRILATLFLPLVWHFLNPNYVILFVAIVLLTDSLDGFLARKFNVTTLFGSLLDAIADKVFGITLLIIVSTINPWFYILVFCEVLIAIINITAAIKGATTKSTFLGKTKMWILSISIIMCLISYFKDIGYIDINLITNNIKNIVEACLFITCGSELIVIVDYLKHIIIELKSKKMKIKYKIKDKKKLMYVLFDTKYYLNNKNLPLYQHLLK